MTAPFPDQVPEFDGAVDSSGLRYYLNTLVIYINKIVQWLYEVVTPVTGPIPDKTVLGNDSGISAPASALTLLPNSLIPAATLTEFGGLKASAGAVHEFVTDIDATGTQNTAQPAISDLQDIAALTFVSNTTGAPAAPSANLLSTLPALIAQYAAAAAVAGFTIDSSAIVRPVDATGGSFTVVMPVALKGFYLIPKFGSDLNPVPIYDDVTPTPNLLFTLVNGGSGFAIVFANGTAAYAYGVQ